MSRNSHWQPANSLFLQTLLEKADSVIYSYRLPPHAKIEYVSESIEKLTGYSTKEFNENNGLLSQIIHAEDLQQFQTISNHVLEFPGQSLACRLWRKDSALIWIEHINLPILDEQGNLVKIQGIARDITAAKQLESRDHLIKEVALMVLDDKPLNTILAHVCKCIVEIYGLNFSWIGMKESDGSVSIGAAEGTPSPWPGIGQLKVRWDDSVEGQGVAGKVIRSGQTIIVNLEREIFNPWYDRLMRRNIRSVAAFPLKTKGFTLGSLAIYSTYKDFFSHRIINEIEDFAEQIALAINDAITKQRLEIVTAGLNSVINAVAITDQTFAIKWANQSFQSLMQLEPGAISNNFFYQLIPSPQNEVFFYSRISKHVMSGSIWQQEILLSRSDTSKISAEMTVMPVKDAQSTISHFIIVLIDLTHRNQAENALQRYQLLFQQANDIILIIRPDGRIIEANPAAIRAYGYSHEMFLTMNVTADFEPMLTIPVDNIGFSDVSADKIGVLWETQHHKYDGTTFPVEVSFVSAVIGGEPVFFSMIRDVSDRKQAELHKIQVKETLAQAEKLSSLGRMAASISHEINQPLNSIKVITDSIKYWQRKGINAEVPELLSAIENISAQSDKIDKVIKHVRAFLHGKNDSLLVPCKINSVIETSINFLESQFTSNGIRLQKILAADLPMVLATPTGLEEIIINLIINAQNALKEMKKKEKSITVTTEMVENKVVLTVVDNGPGISESIMSQIFEPFFSTRNSEGMGLGLAIVKSIITSYHGHISVKTASQGGAIFRVEFPCWQQEHKEGA